MNEQLIEEIMKNFEQHILYSKLAIYWIIEKHLKDKLVIDKKVYKAWYKEWANAAANDIMW